MTLVARVRAGSREVDPNLVWEKLFPTIYRLIIDVRWIEVSGAMKAFPSNGKRVFGWITWSVAGLVGILAVPVQGAVIFQENFDNSPTYTDNGTVPTGLNQISYGQWGLTATNNSSITTPTANYLSATRSMNVHKGDTGSTSNIIGYFGNNNTSTITTTESIKLTMAFQLPDQSTTAEVWVRNSDWNVLGYIQLRSFTSTAHVRCYDGGSPSPTQIAIDMDTWYYLSILMPANPTTGGSYSYSVFESDGTTLVGSSGGAFFHNPAGATNYRTVTLLMNDSTANTSILFDNVKVETVPEPGLVGMAAFGLVLMVLGRRHRRRA